MLVTTLCKPIPGADPAGVDTSLLPEFDRIMEARRADDASLDQGEWTRELKVADWPAVARLCHEALCERTKDLRLVGWYIEARTQLGGLSGLAEGLEVLAELTRQWWAELHPRDDDDEERSGCLRWLASQIPRWLASLPSPRESLPDHASPRSRAMDAVIAIDKHVERHAPGAGPSWSAVRQLLHDLAPSAHAILSEPDAAAEVVGGHGIVPTAPDHPTFEPSSIHHTRFAFTDRAEALAALREISHFFSRTEPHSPVGYLADKAVRWADMPLHDWLAHVLGHGDALTDIQRLLGVRAGGVNA